MVACNQRALSAYLDSGLERPGAARVRIEAPDSGAEEGQASMPAVRRNRTGTYLDDWLIVAAAPTTVTVYASCPSRGRLVAARFEHVPLRPGLKLRLRDRGPGGTWLLTAPDGSPEADAFPFPLKAKDGTLVPAAPEPGRALACGG
jgi:hypothetical protein